MDELINQASLKEQYKSALAKVGIATERLKEENIVDQFKEEFPKRAGKSLLVYDDVFSRESMQGFVPQVGCHVLYTSRDSLGWREAEKIDLDVFQPDESVRYLFDETGANKDLHDNRETALKIAEALGNLPLALEQAASYISIKKISFLAYLNKFSDQPQVLLNSKSKRTNYKHVVATTWKITMESLSYCAQKLMNYFAYIGSNDIPLKLFFNLEIDSEIDIEDAADELTQYSMIKRHEGNISIHQLVQKVNRLTFQGNLSALFKEMLFSWFSYWNTNDFDTLRKSQLDKNYNLEDLSNLNIFVRNWYSHCTKLRSYVLELRASDELSIILKIYTGTLSTLLNRLLNNISHCLSRSILNMTLISTLVQLPEAINRHINQMCRELGLNTNDGNEKNEEFLFLERIAKKGQLSSMDSVLKKISAEDRADIIRNAQSIITESTDGRQCMSIVEGLVKIKKEERANIALLFKQMKLESWDTYESKEILEALGSVTPEEREDIVRLTQILAGNIRQESLHAQFINKLKDIKPKDREDIVMHAQPILTQILRGEEGDISPVRRKMDNELIVDSIIDALASQVLKERESFVQLCFKHLNQNMSAFEIQLKISTLRDMGEKGINLLESILKKDMQTPMKNKDIEWKVASKAQQLLDKYTKEEHTDIRDALENLPPQEQESIINLLEELVPTNINGFNCAETIRALRKITIGERETIVRQSLRLFKDHMSVEERLAIMEALAKAKQKKREKIIVHTQATVIPEMDGYARAAIIESFSKIKSKIRNFLLPYIKEIIDKKMHAEVIAHLIGVLSDVDKENLRDLIDKTKQLLPHIKAHTRKFGVILRELNWAKAHQRVDIFPQLFEIITFDAPSDVYECTRTIEILAYASATEREKIVNNIRLLKAFLDKRKDGPFDIFIRKITLDELIKGTIN